MKKLYTRFFLLCLTALLTIGLLNRCKWVPLTAPDDASLLVSISPPEIILGGQAVVTVIGFKANGAPLPDGTIVFFTSDIGTIDPSAETLGGTARAVFRSSDNRSGTAHINVSSGNARVTPASNTVIITGPLLARLALTAKPPVLPVGGGTSDILVIAFDENMNPLPGIPILLTTTAGTLKSGGRSLHTDSSGAVYDRLTTTADATVAARSGDITGSVDVEVKVNTPPTASFFYSPKSPKIAETVYFNASESSDKDGYIVRYEWDFGDGKTAAGVKVSHRYATAQTFKVILVVYDNYGDKDSDVQEITVAAPAAIKGKKR